MTDIIQKIKSQFAIPVIRQTDPEILEKICLALADGGMKVLEVTLMSEDALKVIKKLSMRDDLIIGAGTVLNLDQTKIATEAGAKFLVSPGLDTESVNWAQKHSIPFVPGVLTPSEVMLASSLGCSIVKVFPISSLGGATYLKSLKGPFPNMQWMATGGVSIHDFRSFAEAGVSCVGLGNQITPTELLNAKDWSGLTILAKKHMEEAMKVRRKE